MSRPRIIKKYNTFCQVYGSLLQFKFRSTMTRVLGSIYCDARVKNKRQRVCVCVRRAALEVVSAETVPVRMYSGNQYGNHEVTYTWNRGEQKEFWLLVIRIYFSGADIPIDALPGAVKPSDDGSTGQGKRSTADHGDMPCCRLL